MIAILIYKVIYWGRKPPRDNGPGTFEFMVGVDAFLTALSAWAIWQRWFA